MESGVWCPKRTATAIKTMNEMGRVAWCLKQTITMITTMNEVGMVLGV
jgi:hypothetical protein